MTSTKLFFSITLLTLLLLLNSCTKSQRTTEKVKNTWKRSKTDRIETDKYIDAGDIYLQKLHYDSAYYCFSKAKISAEIKRDTSRIILSLLNLAKINYVQADYAGAETTATAIVPLLEKKRSHNYNYNLNLLLGNIATATLEHENALSYYSKALQLKTITSNEKIRILNNIGSVYKTLEQFEKAAYIFEYILTKKEISNDIETYTILLTNLGYCYFKSGNPKALEYFLKSLHLALKTNNISKVYTYRSLAEFHKNKDLNLAKNYALVGYRNATVLKLPEDRLSFLQLLIEFNTGTVAKNYALEYLN